MAWRWDRTHFTLDSSTHKIDGWHDDTITPVAANQRGSWYGFNEKYRMMRLRAEDDAILEVIKTFLKEAA